MNSLLQIGVIGAGRIGKLHAENLATRVRGARLAAIADPILPAAQAIAAQFNVPQAVADYQRVLDDRTIDAVVIASPTDTHARIIQEAAAVGKHIFCEKPIDLGLEKIDRALAAVARAGVKLQIGFNRRFDANFAVVHEQIASGKLGRLDLVHIISRDPAPPPLEYLRVSGGIFLDMTIHDFDMARFLSGSEVQEVYAVGDVRIDPQIRAVGDIDTAVTVLRFANGAIGTIDNSRQAVYGYDQRVEAFGANGSIMTSNKTPHLAVISDAQGVHAPLPLYFFLERYTESFVAEMQAFVEAIRNDQTPPVTGQDGRAAVVLGLAAKKSFEEKRPVRASEIGGYF